MDMSLRVRIELMRQGIIQRGIIPKLEERGFLPSPWRRPVSLEDLELREGSWAPNYSVYTTWETYKREGPLHVFFNTFSGDVFERAYRYCFVEYLIPWLNFDLNINLIGVFTRLNLRDGGYIWKKKTLIDLTNIDAAVNEIEKNHDELLLELTRYHEASG